MAVEISSHPLRSGQIPSGRSRRSCGCGWVLIEGSCSRLIQFSRGILIGRHCGLSVEVLVVLLLGCAKDNATHTDGNFKRRRARRWCSCAYITGLWTPSFFTRCCGSNCPGLGSDEMLLGSTSLITCGGDQPRALLQPANNPKEPHTRQSLASHRRRRGRRKAPSMTFPPPTPKGSIVESLFRDSSYAVNHVAANTQMYERSTPISPGGCAEVRQEGRARAI